MSLLEQRINEESLDEPRVKPRVMFMRRRRLDWFGHVKIRDETENIRAVVELKMEGSALEEDIGCDGNILSEGH